MIGGFINKKGERSTFEMGVCECCRKGGKIHGTLEKHSKRPATFMLSHHVPWLYEQVDIEGRRYDRMCFSCVEKTELFDLPEVKGQ